jgi:Tol biopolymer transport system component
VLGNSFSGDPAISADGRYVAFASAATNLVLGDTNGQQDIFVHDRVTGTTERVSVDSAGAQANGASGVYGLSISSDGRYVAFQSDATNLVVGDTNNASDVFVHDRQSGTTERVSVDSAGMQGNGGSDYPSISADGRYVAFVGGATNLVPGDTNGQPDIFVHDRVTGTTERVSVDSAGAQANGASDAASISADGRYVAYGSLASNLVPGDTNGVEDVFLHDRQLGITERISVNSAGFQGNNLSDGPSISGDVRFVAFYSLATNLVAGSLDGVFEVFVRDRDASGFTGLCDPGVAGVAMCPCSNPPSGPAHGCDNSSATGGASLTASGTAYITMDSLVFITSGEKPTATSIVLQGNSLVAGGLVFGQGVRCVDGRLKRMYTKSAIGGSIIAPDAFDVPVSEQSAALGDPIAAGQSRWYLVYYRDPIVLGGCPASSTFNATQTGRVDWSP